VPQLGQSRKRLKSNLENNMCRVRIAIAMLASIGNAGCMASGGGMTELGDHSLSNGGSTNRTLADIVFAETTTRAQVVARWGQSISVGPANSLELYSLDSGERLWLSFAKAEPHVLTRAIRLSNAPVPKTTVLMNKIPATVVRRCGQIDFSKPTTAERVTEIWGPPDNVVGSGIENWSYQLSDGTSAILIFSQDQVVSVKGCPV
jgi:hypothetical protein